MTSAAKQRVAIVVSELRPGGMERLVVHLATELSLRGFPVKIICLQSPGVLASLLIEQNIPVVALESHGSRDIFALWKLRKELKQFRTSLVHLHDYSSLPYAALANILSLRCSLLFTAHGLLYEGFENLQRRNRFFCHFIKSLSAVSNKVAARHKEYLNWSKPVHIIANGVPAVAVDKASCQIIRDELHCSDEIFLFLAVGNPRPEKGFEDLLEAAVTLRQHKCKFLIAVAGTLTDSQYCRELFNKLDRLQLADNFKFLGFRDDTAALYCAADCFVLSSRSEGLPMVILEAMMAGLPVVATRVGGIPDAIGDNALLVDAQNPLQLAESMMYMMNDATVRNRLAAKGKEHVEKNFGVEPMVDEYLKWYQKVIDA
jgi:glycosyltransferase involved in cell wall biosynthesis